MRKCLWCNWTIFHGGKTLGTIPQQIFIFTELKSQGAKSNKSREALSHCIGGILQRSFPSAKKKKKIKKNLLQKPLKPAWANFLINDVTIKWPQYSYDGPYRTWWNHKKGFYQSNVCMQQYGARHHSSTQPQGWISMSHLAWVRNQQVKIGPVRMTGLRMHAFN